MGGQSFNIMAMKLVSRAFVVFKTGDWVKKSLNLEESQQENCLSKMR